MTTVLWIGGSEAASAFGESSDLQYIIEKYSIYNGKFGSAVVYGEYHPSASLSAHGDTDKLFKIQASLHPIIE